MHIRCAARLENRNRLFDLCKQAVGETLYNNPSFREFLIAVEETFVNICSYAYEGEGAFDFYVTLQDATLSCRFEDEGVAFDPLSFDSEEHAEFNLDHLIIGGLGIRLIKNSMEQLQYRRENQKNIFSFQKTLEGIPADQ